MSESITRERSPFSRSPSISVEENQDISGATVATQETLPLTKTESLATDSLATEADCETPENELESEDEDEDEDEEDEEPNPHAGEVGMVSIFLAGGLIISAFAFFLSRQIDTQGAHSSHDYF